MLVSAPGGRFLSLEIEFCKEDVRVVSLKVPSDIGLQIFLQLWCISCVAFLSRPHLRSSVSCR